MFRAYLTRLALSKMGVKWLIKEVRYSGALCTEHLWLALRASYLLFGYFQNRDALGQKSVLWKEKKKSYPVCVV